MKRIVYTLMAVAMLTACDDMFDPGIENNKTKDEMYQNPSFAYDILGTAYALLNFSNTANQTDVASDDAVTNNFSSGFRDMAIGKWSATMNPYEKWRQHRYAIQVVNMFMTEISKVKWATDPLIDKMYEDRVLGESLALRAMHTYTLLQAHSGIGAKSGKLLGVPVLTTPEDVNSDFSTPRSTFEKCVEQLYNDLDQALELLPEHYQKHTEVPQKYKDLGVTQVEDYDRVNGPGMVGQIDGHVVRAFRAQVALFTASPAYFNGANESYELAASYATEVINSLGGIEGIDPIGHTWYCNQEQIAGLGIGVNPKEIIWRGSIQRDNAAEKEYFPPTLYGNGSVNPTQDFVNAFPMADGTPIGTRDSQYDKLNPYANRDPRLSANVIFNGAKQGVANSVIETAKDGTTLDAINKENGKSTRTGYYLRKYTRSYVNPDPNATVEAPTYPARIRATEIFLIYAEAANEAFGPTTAAPGANFSAYDVIKALRARGGITGDAYIESIKGDKDSFRELIRNERRIELAFENKRFWDLRRWNVPLAQLNQSVVGVEITSETNFNYIDVEERKYEDYMYYGPIPDTEVLKFGLEQNKGW